MSPCFYACCAIAIVLLGTTKQLGSEEVTDAGESAVMAQCGLQTLSGTTSTTMLSNGQPAATRVGADRSAFRHGVEGDWIVSHQVDADDPVISCLLLTPARPLRFDVSITVAGNPFRSIRERWIDEALAAASKKQPVDTASKEPSGQTDAKPESAVQADAALPADDVEKEPIEADKNLEPDQPPMTPSAFQAPSPKEWLTRYLSAAGESIDRSEARWLLSQRAGGPELLELHRFATPRSVQAPLMHVLDRDGDAMLSAEELTDVEQQLAAFDRNENDLIEITELRTNNSGKPSRNGFLPWQIQPQLVVLDDTCDVNQLRTLLAERYHATDDSTLSDKEYLNRCRSTPADFVVSVPFYSEEAEVTGSVTSNGMRLHATSDSLVASFDGTWIEFSAGAPKKTTTELSQASIGSSVEGSPLWNLLDTNQDGLLSIRERNKATQTLLALDRDGNNILTHNEIPTWIRISVGWGPEVAQLLEPTRRSPVRQSTDEKATAPTWFVSMDANGDGDLSPDEFLGGPQQFSQLDVDGDNLISPAEAITK